MTQAELHAQHAVAQEIAKAAALAYAEAVRAAEVEVDLDGLVGALAQETVAAWSRGEITPNQVPEYIEKLISDLPNGEYYVVDEMEDGTLGKKKKSIFKKVSKSVGSAAKKVGKVAVKAAPYVAAAVAIAATAGIAAAALPAIMGAAPAVLGVAGKFLSAKGGKVPGSSGGIAPEPSNGTPPPPPDAPPPPPPPPPDVPPPPSAPPPSSGGRGSSGGGGGYSAPPDSGPPPTAPPPEGTDWVKIAGFGIGGLMVAQALGIVDLGLGGSGGSRRRGR